MSILPRLRKELTNLRLTPPGRGDGVRKENIEENVDSDISSDNAQTVEAVENSKMRKRSGNVIENKGSCLENQERSGNIMENKCSYAQNAGNLLKRRGVSCR